MDDNVIKVNRYIKSIAKGDVSALDLLFQDFGGLLFIIARKYLADKSYAEDLVSDVLLKLIKCANQFKDGENGLNWLFKIIKNTAININISRGNIILEDIDDYEHIAQVFCEDNLLHKSIIVQALSSLDKEEKKLIELKYWEGYTIREIANKLDMSVTTTQRKIKIILAKMGKNFNTK